MKFRADFCTTSCQAGMNILMFIIDPNYIPFWYPTIWSFLVSSGSWWISLWCLLGSFDMNSYIQYHSFFGTILIVRIKNTSKIFVVLYSQKLYTHVLSYNWVHLPVQFEKSIKPRWKKTWFLLCQMYEPMHSSDSSCPPL